jgi:hypothetical protein
VRYIYDGFCEFDIPTNASRDGYAPELSMVQCLVTLPDLGLTMDGCFRPLGIEPRHSGLDTGK